LGFRALRFITHHASRHAARHTSNPIRHTSHVTRLRQSIAISLRHFPQRERPPPPSQHKRQQPVVRRHVEISNQLQPTLQMQSHMETTPHRVKGLADNHTSPPRTRCPHLCSRVPDRLEIPYAAHGIAALQPRVKLAVAVCGECTVKVEGAIAEGQGGGAGEGWGAG
jgi:hypothetical protein